ncbi:MAG: hypothetical protein WKF50_10115 [Nocardioides sp.]
MNDVLLNRVLLGSSPPSCGEAEPPQPVAISAAASTAAFRGPRISLFMSL